MIKARNPLNTHTNLQSRAHVQRGGVEAGLEAAHELLDVAGHAAVQGVPHKAVHELQPVAPPHRHLRASGDQLHVGGGLRRGNTKTSK